MGIWTNLFARKNGLTKFSNYKSLDQMYSIDYPESWKVKRHEDGVTSIESDQMKGGIYISAYQNISFPDEHMADFIVDANNLTADFKQQILNSEANGIRSWHILYTDTINNLTCTSMYKRKKDKLWFISIEIEPDLWENGWKEVVIKILSSFKITAT